MSGESLLILLEGDDGSLSGVGAESQLDGLDLVGGLVLDLGGGEVEVAVTLGTENQGVTGKKREKKDI